MRTWGRPAAASGQEAGKGARARLPDALVPIVLVTALAGCTTEKLSLGVACERTSECDAPLVCRIGLCRNECNTTRDCAAGLSCVRDEVGLGACQLPAERTCVRNSDCPLPLVCRLGQCVNECMANIDCPAGARCLLDDATGSRGCVDMAEQPCVRTSECAALEGRPQTCAVDGRCRDECLGDRDCRFGTSCCADAVCRADCGATGPIDAGTSMDASVDGRAPDARVDTGPGTDAGGLPAPTGPCDPPSGRDPVAQIAAGNDFTCARLESGRVYCWGSNTNGALGSGGPMMPAQPPSEVAGLGDATAVSAAADYACAIRETGDVVCWGRLPGPGGAVSPEPETIAGLSDVVSLSTGDGVACAVVAGVGPFCWGSNDSGQLGNPGFPAGSAMPVPVIGGSSTARRIAVSTLGGCVLQDSGPAVPARPWCWGRGPVGDGSLADQPMAETLSVLIANASALVVSPQSRCVFATSMEPPFDEGTFCWGANADGTVGNGTTTPLLDPTLVGFDGLRSFGDGLACHPAADGVYCWGTGSPDGSLVPTRVATSSDVARIDVGDAHVCALRTDGTVTCFGDNASGELGNCMSMPVMPGAAGEVLGLP